MDKKMVKNFTRKILLKLISLKNQALDEQIGSEEKNGMEYITYWRRPKKAKYIEYFTESDSSPEIAIVVQGPIISEDNFTLETIKLYRKLYKQCPIIISTWMGENNEEIKRICRIENTYVIRLERPQNTGFRNLNYQRVNTKAGIEYAKELGCKYVLKTRTDQRMYANNSIAFLKRLVDIYPLKINAPVRGRIAVCNLSTIKNRMYNMCDMLLFGYIEDMLLYFSPIEPQKWTDEMTFINEFEDPVRFAQQRAGEHYFTTHYIENCGFTLKWTFEDSDYYRNNLFIVFNSESVDLFWPKYNRKEYMWRSYNTEKYDLATFEDWLLKQGLNDEDVQ